MYACTYVCLYLKTIYFIRFVFWIDNYKLWRRHYDESKAHQISAFQKKDDRLTTDHLCKSVHLGDYQIQYGIVNKTLNVVITPLPENIYSGMQIKEVKHHVINLFLHPSSNSNHSSHSGTSNIRSSCNGLTGSSNNNSCQ